MHILIPSNSPATVTDGVCRIDRKFHTGACLYAENIDAALVCLAREATPAEVMMDSVEIPLADMPYRVETVRCNSSMIPLPNELARIGELVRNSYLVYGTTLKTAPFAHRYGVPYIAITEYSLPTQLQMARLDARTPLRRVSRQFKTVLRFLVQMREISRGVSVHCNGYPTFVTGQRFHEDCFMYLDSRMSTSMVIGESDLEARTQNLANGRRPRLLFSGRYEPIKGAQDVIKVGLELLARGMDFELHVYGRGSLRDKMVALASTAGDRINIHDGVPFPELARLSRTFDLFVCCHIQGDPSCTYIESMGAGLPVVGYANEMWREMVVDSQAGIAVPVGDVSACAHAIESLVLDRRQLEVSSRAARSFALRHSFEREFGRRIEHLQRFVQ